MRHNGEQLASWLQPQQILLDIEVQDRFDALDVMAQAIAERNGLDGAPIARALRRREMASPAAVGDGFAIPHARIDGLARPLTLFMRTASPIEFAAPDGEPARDLLAILVPHDGNRDVHLQLLAMVAEIFSDRAFRRGLDRALDAVSAGNLFSDRDSRLSARGFPTPTIFRLHITLARTASTTLPPSLAARWLPEFIAS